MKTNVVMSMVNPSTDALMTKVESRYGLVVLAARRARQLMTGAEVKAKNQSTKNVTNALEEIVEGKITYEITKDYRDDDHGLTERTSPEEEPTESGLDAEESLQEMPEEDDEEEEEEEPDTEDVEPEDLQEE